MLLKPRRVHSKLLWKPRLKVSQFLRTERTLFKQRVWLAFKNETASDAKGIITLLKRFNHKQLIKTWFHMSSRHAAWMGESKNKERKRELHLLDIVELMRNLIIVWENWGVVNVFWMLKCDVAYMFSVLLRFGGASFHVDSFVLFFVAVENFFDRGLEHCAGSRSFSVTAGRGTVTWKYKEFFQSKPGCVRHGGFVLLKCVVSFMNGVFWL